MQNDIVADIVRRALAPEPVSEDGSPRETPLEERLRLLNSALGSTQQRVQAQQDQLGALRRQIDEYRSLVDKMKDRAVETERLAKLVQLSPAAPPAPVSVAPPPPVVALPEFVPEATTPVIEAYPSAPPTRSWAAYEPYAALAVFGLALHLGMASAGRAPAPGLRVAAVPAPSPVPATLAEPETSDSDILALIHEFVPPGGSRSVQEILEPELEAPAADSPWTIVRVDDKTTLVSFRPYGDVLENGPVYEFMVDPAAKTVQASPETLANLRGGDVASVP